MFRIGNNPNINHLIFCIMYQRQVSFKEAIVSALSKNYCNFSGRASRSEFWWFYLFCTVLGWVVSLVFMSSDTVSYIASGILSLALILPNLGLAVRRLHDIDKSGWWIFLSLIPVVGIIILIVWWCQNSQMQPNQYGPVPNMTA